MNLRVDIGRGCQGFPPHRHVDTMGWPEDTITQMTYLTYGAPLLLPDGPVEIYPGLTLEVDAKTPHGVAQSDGRCPVSGQPRTVLLISWHPKVLL